MGRNAYQKIHEIIETSESLNNEEKREFSEVFAQTKEEALRPVLKLLEADASWVDRLYANYRMKKEAIVTGSMDAWQDAIEHEKQHIEQV